MEDKKCIKCGDKENLRYISLSQNDGFCMSSTTENICKDCWNKNKKMTSVGLFLKINNELYYDEYEYSLFERINSKRDLDLIFNREYYEVLNMLKSD